MIKIMYLTTDQEELHIAMEYARKKGISLYPKTLPAPEEDYVRMCIEIARDRDVDVIVAKGRILSWLQKLKCPVLVIPVRITFGRDSFCPVGGSAEMEAGTAVSSGEGYSEGCAAVASAAQY